MIRVGPGGTAGLGYDEGISQITKLGLNALEVEFTYGVRMSDSEASRIGKLAKKNDISLSVHGPYYINLASDDPSKVSASKQRILQSAQKADLLGARYVVFHAGFFQKKDPKEVFEMIRENMIDVMEDIKEHGFRVMLAPEVTGKGSQFGSISELLDLMKATGCHMTIDFAHQLARNSGNIDYAEIFDSLSGIKHLHAHFSGIEWTDKGEKKHLITKKEWIMPLAEEIIKRKSDITLINESPDPLGDSVKTKEVFESKGIKI